MSKRFVVIGTLVFALLLLVAPYQASAATYYYDQSYLGGGTCNTTTFSAPVSIAWSTPAGGMVRRYDNAAPTASGFVSGTGSVPSTNLSNNLAVGAIPYTYTIDYYVVDSTNTSIYQTKVVVTCGVGNVFGIQITNNYAAPAPAKFEGPKVPSGFELRTITCDVAVFNAPGGIPLATGEKIKAGQTWFVNPTPVTVTNNELYPQWTEIFNSGYTNGYIPTACVGQ